MDKKLASNISYLLKNFDNLSLAPKDMETLLRALTFLKTQAQIKIIEKGITNNEGLQADVAKATARLYKEIEVFEKYRPLYQSEFMRERIAQGEIIDLDEERLSGLKKHLNSNTDAKEVVTLVLGKSLIDEQSQEYKDLTDICVKNLTYGYAGDLNDFLKLVKNPQLVSDLLANFLLESKFEATLDKYGSVMIREAALDFIRPKYEIEKLESHIRRITGVLDTIQEKKEIEYRLKEKAKEDFNLKTNKELTSPVEDSKEEPKEILVISKNPFIRFFKKLFGKKKEKTSFAEDIKEDSKPNTNEEIIPPVEEIKEEPKPNTNIEKDLSLIKNYYQDFEFDYKDRNEHQNNNDLSGEGLVWKIYKQCFLPKAKGLNINKRMNLYTGTNLEEAPELQNLRNFDILRSVVLNTTEEYRINEISKFISEKQKALQAEEDVLIKEIISIGEEQNSLLSTFTPETQRVIQDKIYTKEVVEGVNYGVVEGADEQAGYTTSPFVATLILEALVKKEDLTKEDLEELGFNIDEKTMQELKDKTEEATIIVQDAVKDTNKNLDDYER